MILRREVAALLAHEVGRLQGGHPRLDLLVTLGTLPGELVLGVVVGVGRRLAWVPPGRFAWRTRFVVGSTAVVLETQAGRWPSPIVIAVFIALSYLLPRCRHAWHRRLCQAADRHAAGLGLAEALARFLRRLSPSPRTPTSSPASTASSSRTSTTRPHQPSGLDSHATSSQRADPRVPRTRARVGPVSGGPRRSLESGECPKPDALPRRTSSPPGRPGRRSRTCGCSQPGRPDDSVARVSPALPRWRPAHDRWLGRVATPAFSSGPTQPWRRSCPSIARGTPEAG